MIPRHRVIALVAALLCLGCTGPAASHPALGRMVKPLPLVSVADPSRPPPVFLDKVTLLNFWATWCPPCRRELPGLARLAARLAGEPRFQLVAVACDQEAPDSLAPAVARFLADQRVELDAWIDPDTAVQAIATAEYGFSSLPTSYLIGPDGRVQRVWVGYRGSDEADMARAIVAALKDGPLTAPASPAAR